MGRTKSAPWKEGSGGGSRKSVRDLGSAHHSRGRGNKDLGSTHYSREMDSHRLFRSFLLILSARAISILDFSRQRNPQNTKLMGGLLMFK